MSIEVGEEAARSGWALNANCQSLESWGGANMRLIEE